MEWVTATEVAKELGVQRQWLNLMIKDGQFKSVRVLGERPIYVISRAEVDAYKVEFAKRAHKRTKPEPSITPDSEYPSIIERPHFDD
jgi:excisionase family DNA binding protein